MLANAGGGGGGQVGDTVQAIAETHDQIILALVAIIAASVGALVFVIRGARYARTGAEQATAANSAVNNVGPGQHTLYNLVASIKADVDHLKEIQEEFGSLGWQALPADLHDAPALTATVRELQRSTTMNEAILRDIQGELRRHVIWEETQKYPQTMDGEA